MATWLLNSRLREKIDSLFIKNATEIVSVVAQTATISVSTWVVGTQVTAFVKKVRTTISIWQAAQTDV